MVPQLALYFTLLLGGWLIYRDQKARPDVGAASWVPTIWVLILASRPVSTWFGMGSAGNDFGYSLDGSPVDRVCFLLLLGAAVFIILRRQVDLPSVVSENKVLFLFYAYLLISVFWASSPFVSFKRWFKDFGNIIVALVILSEENPLSTFKAVFVRCAYLLIPLSLVFVRYFPDLGRRYSVHSGLMEATGVTFQKNSLGAMVLVSGLILFWDFLERFGQASRGVERLTGFGRVMVLAIGGYLLLLSDSKTATVCLALGGAILLASRLPILRRNAASLAWLAIGGALVFLVLDQMFDIREAAIAGLGRDMTFTGRTDVWRKLLSLNTDPLFGTGFCDFWSNAMYRKQLPEWVAFSAHNGYLEMYLDGGNIGVGLLVLMLFSVAFKIIRRLNDGAAYEIVRFSVLVITIIYNFSESIYGRISPGWFIFLLVAIDYPSTTQNQDALEEAEAEKPEQMCDEATMVGFCTRCPA